jgi:hypothetical protein
MKAGEGLGNFIFDLHNGVPKREMEVRYKRGIYGKLRKDYVRGYVRLANRTMEWEQ